MQIVANEFEMIPAEMKERMQWVLWKLEYNGGKPTKIPYQINGSKATSTNPATWTDYDKALDTFDNGQYNGVGYVLTSNDEYTGVDLDDCITDEKVNPAALTIVRALNSYTEYSQSGTGLHIIVKGKKPGSRSKNPDKNIEIYESNRFLIMTGKHVKGSPTTIESRQSEIDKIYNHYFPNKKPDHEQEQIVTSNEMTDQDLLSIGFKAKNGKHFSELYAGNWGSYGSQSEADQALCNHIAFYTQEPSQIDRIFETSGLMRDKWNREDYKTDTIENAIQGLNATYQPQESKSVNTDQFFSEKGKFLHHEFSCHLAAENHIITLDDRLHIYKNGVYVANEKLIKRRIVDIIPTLTENRRREVMYQLQYITDTREHAEPKYIGVNNGVYDITENQLFDTSPNFILTNQINADYDPGANDENVIKLIETLSNNDVEVVRLLEEVIGYTLYRKNVFEKSFLFIGNGGNGKSTFFNMLSTFLGESNIAALSLSDLSERFKTGVLQGKLANIGDDIPGSDIRDTSHFKKLSTGERVTAEFKGQDPFEFRNYSKLMFSANSIPRLYDNSDGIMRRLVTIPFNSNVRNHSNYDPFIESKVTTDQARSTLLNIGINGLNRLMKNQEFTNPLVVTQKHEEFRIANDPIQEWLSETNINEIPISSAYADYKNWCEHNGHTRTLSKNKLTRELKRIGYETNKTYVNGIQVRCYFKMN